jgi:uncharacterized protein YgiM (DUF1202 family)
MNKRILLLSLFAVNVLYVGASLAEALYYVQSASAKVLSAPSFKSNVIAEIGMGQSLSFISKEGGWVKVSHAGKEGYISSLLVSAHPPLKKVEVIKAEDPDIKEGVRRRTSSYSSAAAARGLTKEDRHRADIDEGVDYRAVTKMESQTFADSEVNKFVAGGSL